MYAYQEFAMNSRYQDFRETKIAYKLLSSCLCSCVSMLPQAGECHRWHSWERELYALSRESPPIWRRTSQATRQTEAQGKTIASGANDKGRYTQGRGASGGQDPPSPSPSTTLRSKTGLFLRAPALFLMSLCLVWNVQRRIYILKRCHKVKRSSGPFIS